MAAKKRPDVSWVNPGAKGTNKEKFISAVQTISETSETKEDIYRGPSLIAAVGAKYGQNPTAAIARFKKSFVDNNPTNTPVSWRASSGINNKEVNKLYRPMGR